ncbi:hypothetical protein SAMN00768000_0243 [Sulfobacillus thermosulfidooxidans DSM 9293]|uniref:Uncharacterized protein n=1 Tax=Sulfobacillus thermosulfidooxidans (strain DSM 9293 / VKM B-1269 / AT-1) TaxID=929705 RepID=A0A1W1W8F3_SULTA|nr:hypothetical protein [Sulfobacillus thermosulfidooxidans]SMC02033.1 hypothetical protein SAMN00768000_0243 [Sulfobacillus thermosulfidooxidans DSM 9293]
MVFPDTLRYQGRPFTALWPWEDWQVYMDDEETHLVFVSRTDFVAYLLELQHPDDGADMDHLMAVFRERRVRIPGDARRLWQEELSQ